MNTTTNLDLHPAQILEWEFQYAAETAAHAQNDRTRVVNFYLLLVGAISSFAIGLVQFASNPINQLPGTVLPIIFLLLAISGFFAAVKLVRLRQAWYDSVLTMNRIKDFYLARFPNLADAFRWRTQTIPAPGKPWSITFVLTLLVMIIDSSALAVAVQLTGWRVPLSDYAVAAFAALVFFAWQLFYYFLQLPISHDGHA